MFQYAFALSLSKRKTTNVLLDNSYFSNCVFKSNLTSTRSFELKHFNISLNTISWALFPPCLCLRLAVNFVKFCRKILKFKKTPIDSIIIVEKDGLRFQENLLNPKKAAYYSGYFLCEQYFKPHREDILKEFSLTTPLSEANQKMLDQIKKTNAVSLHIRRGDYLNNPQVFTLCSLDYYKKAIKYIAERVESPHFYLFSNDPEWVIQNLKIDHPSTCVAINDENTGFYDLELMKNCKHNIIANSSFSWWGAWLNTHSEKIIIAPQQWLNGRDDTNTDIVPDQWIKM